MQSRVLNINDSWPNEKEMAIIKDLCCIHCRTPYNPLRKVRFVRLHDGTLIWWHVFNQNEGQMCPAVYDKEK